MASSRKPSGRRIALLLAAVLLAACGGRAQPGGTVPPPPGTTLTVEESEFRIVPQDLAAGPGRLTFQIKNVGTVEHNFVVEGTAVKLESIQPGETQTAAVDLAAGTYRMVCTIPGHEEAGMVGTLEVSP